MSEDTSPGDKDTIDRSELFAVYNVYRKALWLFDYPAAEASS